MVVLICATSCFVSKRKKYSFAFTLVASSKTNFQITNTLPILVYKYTFTAVVK